MGLFDLFKKTAGEALKNGFKRKQTVQFHQRGKVKTARKASPSLLCRTVLQS